MVTDLLLESLMARYRQLEDGDHTGLESEYLEHLFLLNRPGEYSSRGESFQGTIIGLNEVGELLVERDGLSRAYGFQEISFLLGQAKN